jgi:hypothetical protein
MSSIVRGAAEQPDAADEVHVARGDSASPWPSQLIRVFCRRERGRA